jgi:response regulator RpfG family c-di-GMP phosphodiesterase
MARIGKYVITGELGRGASCIVHSTLDPVVGRQVAVKSVSKAGPPAAVKADIERLQREVQVAGTLHHGNIVSVYEYGEDAANAWIAMEMLNPKTLRQHLAEGYKASLDPLAALVVEVLEALEYAHSRGVCHGDLRADNVLLSPHGSAKLIGFGGRGEERSDVVAAAAMLKEAFAEPPPVLDAPPASARELLDALRKKSAVGGAKLAALRRAIKAGPAPVAAPPRRLPAVLFVDDEERVLHALAALFDGVYDVETVASGAAALERIKARRFLVVVSDQRMPGMTGVELLREARTLAPTAVRLLLTGYSDFSAIVASVNESEIFRYVTKPWQQAELQATLAEAVEVAIAVEAAAAGGRHWERARGQVLVVGQPALARGVRELSAGGVTVREAFDEESVLDMVSHEDIGVVLADLDRDVEEPEAILHVLKKAAPQTQLVVVSDLADPDLGIRLINEARIHRYLPKPVNLSILQQAIVSGLQRHASLQGAPGLGETERATKRRATSRLRRLFERVKALGGRLKLFNGTVAR